jgi:hypothetical protein
LTVSVTESLAEPLVALRQLSVYVNVPAADGVTDSLPFSALVPLQGPLALHAVYCHVIQLKVADCPSVIDTGDTERFTDGGGVLTVSVAEADLEPLPPVQLRP